MRKICFEIHEGGFYDPNKPKDMTKTVTHCEELSDENAMRFELLSNMEKEWLLIDWNRSKRKEENDNLTFDSWLSTQWDDKTHKFRYPFLSQLGL
jgi:hypothetical protein